MGLVTEGVNAGDELRKGELRAEDVQKMVSPLRRPAPGGADGIVVYRRKLPVEPKRAEKG